MQALFLPAHVFVEVLAEQRQRSCHILVLHQNVVRYGQMRGRKVPDGADAVGDQQIADRLCLLGRDGDNADLDFITAADLGQSG